MSSDVKIREPEDRVSSGGHPPKGVKRVSTVPLGTSSTVARGVRKGMSTK